MMLRVELAGDRVVEYPNDADFYIAKSGALVITENREKPGTLKKYATFNRGYWIAAYSVDNSI